MKNIVGWWFTFSDESNEPLKLIIKELSEKYGDGQTFIPHLSFYTCADVEQDEIQLVVNDLSRLVNAFKVKTKGIGFDKPTHKTLFIETEVNDSMMKAVNYMEEKFHKSYSFTPHVSLIYNENLSYKDRRLLSSKIEFPKEIFIDSVSYLSPPVGKESSKYFEEWPEPVKVSLKGNFK